MFLQRSEIGGHGEVFTVQEKKKKKRKWGGGKTRGPPFLPLKRGKVFARGFLTQAVQYIQPCVISFKRKKDSRRKGTFWGTGGFGAGEESKG